jgi:hypothetical protein
MRTNQFVLFVILVFASLLLAACGASGEPSAADLAATQQSLQATQQALNAQPAAATNTVEQPTAAAATEEPTAEQAVSEGEAYYTEEFDTAPATWTYFLLNGDDLDLDLYSESGKMVFDISGENVWSYYTYDSFLYTDVRLDARAENLGNNNNNVSLICRANERGWYEFNVANNGLYTILRYESSSNEFIELYSGGVANLRTGKDTNDYTIMCRGDRLTLGVNGTEIRTVEDNQFDEGQVGISVSSFDGIPVLVEFDYATISAP